MSEIIVIAIQQGNSLGLNRRWVSSIHAFSYGVSRKIVQFEIPGPVLRSTSKIFPLPTLSNLRAKSPFNFGHDKRSSPNCSQSFVVCSKNEKKILSEEFYS